MLTLISFSKEILFGSIDHGDNLTGNTLLYYFILEVLK